MKGTSAVALLALGGSAFAAPAPAPAPVVTPAPDAAALEEKRQLLNLGGDLSSIAAGLEGAISAANSGDVFTSLSKITATTTPTAPSQAVSMLSSIIATASPTNILEYDALLIANGLTIDSVTDIITDVVGEFTGEDSDTNNNKNPPTSVYPKKGSCDAPYSLSESTLRSAIYIPSTFTYGQKPPVILFPGTGSTGYITFIGNFIPLLTDVSYADPVWVNVPGFLLNDAQQNAEFAAYALNYIASLTGQNASIIAWSQGNIDVQWAFKYWPSTRQTTSDHIAISADYKGTVLADFADVSGLGNDPSVVQQQYLSNFITTLRSNNGDSAYVPTTVLYSGFFDEIVEPQQGTNASAYLLDARNVGVSNTEAQLVCPDQPAGSFYTHEGMLYNPLSFALAVDALTHAGPGELSRIDTSTLCQQYLASGLGLNDLIVTENSILVAGIALVAYEPKVASEPAISAYATASSSCTASSPKTSMTSKASTTTSKATTTSKSSSIKTTTTKSATTTSTKSSTSTKTTTTKAATTTSTKSSTSTETTATKA